MSSNVQAKSTVPLWKPAKHEKKSPKPLKRSELKPRNTPIARSTEPMNQRGKAAKGRSADKRTLLKGDPANHEGYHHCYIGDHMVERVDLEHVIDASLRPDLARNPRNHKKACNAHNIAKKEGTLSYIEEIRVQNAIEEVLYEEKWSQLDTSKLQFNEGEQYYD